MAAKKTLHLHEKLGITFQELGALLGARNMLATGLVTEATHDAPRTGSEHIFDMSTKCTKLGCGTVTCIGGLMALIMGVPAGSYVQDYDSGLGALFYPPHDTSNDWYWITPLIAVRAIDNFLNTGKPGWDELHDQYAAYAA